MCDIYFQDHTTKSPWTKTCQFLPTSRKIVQFSEGKEPKAGDRIVYIAGAFDLFRILLPHKASGDTHLNPFTLRVPQESIVCYFHTFENNLEIKQILTKKFEGELLVIF